MGKVDKATRKSNYFAKLRKLLEAYNKILILQVDNVRSKQIQQTRIALRGRAEIIMGKNTMIRKVLRNMLPDRPEFEDIMDCIVGNIGFCFTNDDLTEVRDVLEANKVAAPAKAGAYAPRNVNIQAGPTTMGPEKTSFFQALNIPTKIAKGVIEILSDQHIITKGNRVGASEAALLSMLGINPFSYGLVVKAVYDNGSVFDPSILDIKEEDILSRFMTGVSNIAALSLAIDYPTSASVSHSIAAGFRNLLAIAAVTDISFKQADKVKAFLADPSAFVVAAAPAAAAAAAPAAAAAAKPAAAPAPESESDEEMGFGLFD